jgi:hypothetical protein
MDHKDRRANTLFPLAGRNYLFFVDSLWGFFYADQQEQMGARKGIRGKPV